MHKHWMGLYWIDVVKRGVANTLNIPLNEVGVTVSESGTHLNVNILHYTFQLSEPFITSRLNTFILREELRRQGVDLNNIKAEIVIRKACYDSDVT